MKDTHSVSFTAFSNEGFTRDGAEALLGRGDADAVAFGKPFIANPDLVTRFVKGAPLNEPDVDTFYSQGPKGYTDYPCGEGKLDFMNSITR